METVTIVLSKENFEKLSTNTQAELALYAKNREFLLEIEKSENEDVLIAFLQNGNVGHKINEFENHTSKKVCDAALEAMANGLSYNRIRAARSPCASLGLLLRLSEDYNSKVREAATKSLERRRKETSESVEIRD